MRIGIGKQELQAMRSALVQTYLQGVVTGIAVRTLLAYGAEYAGEICPDIPIFEVLWCDDRRNGSITYAIRIRCAACRIDSHILLDCPLQVTPLRSEEHTSELQSH